MAASNASPYEINEFHGGITEHLFEQDLKRFAVLDNFVINDDKKPSSRDGSVVDDVVNAEIPTGSRIGSLVNYSNSEKLFYQSELGLYYRNPSAFTELIGPTGNKVFSAGDILSVPSYAQWNRHLYVTNDAYSIPMKIYKDGSGNYQVRNSGLPALSSTPTVTAGGVGTESYVYAFCYIYDYTVFNLGYQSIGPTTVVQLLNSTDPVSGNISITNIPVLTNGSTDNYDLSAIKIEIYRTTTGGTFFQKVGEVTNGTMSFIDSTSDIDLQNTGIPLYTNDGTVDFDPVPLHKLNHVVSNTGYYAYIKDANGESPYKVRQSIPGIPDTAPIDFEVSVDDAITGLSSIRNIPIILCEKYIYRIDQFYDQFGRGNMLPIRIQDHAGCISNNSIVQAENGLYWFGNDGVWFTDGYQAMKVTDINSMYKEFLKNTTQKNRITGKFFEQERRVVWSMQRDSANLDNDSFLVLDLKFGTEKPDATFTTWSGNSFRPSALEVFNNEIYRGDIRGFTLKHQEGLTTDPKIDPYRSASDWVDETIMFEVRSINYNFGSTMFRKIPTRILFSATDKGNTTIQITAINDDNKVIRQLKPIRNRRDFVWRSDDFIWRTSTFVWRGSGIIEQWRRFPANNLRASYLQIVISNGFSDIQNSDTLGKATFSNITNTAVLDVATSRWPLDCEDYYISTDVDNYTAEFLIDRRTSDNTITINDPLNVFPTGSKKWVLRGYKKGEALYLLGYNIHWANVSATQETYDSSAAATGENA